MTTRHGWQILYYNGTGNRWLPLKAALPAHVATAEMIVRMVRLNESQGALHLANLLRGSNATIPRRIEPAGPDAYVTWYCIRHEKTPMPPLPEYMW